MSLLRLDRDAFGFGLISGSRAVSLCKLMRICRRGIRGCFHENFENFCCRAWNLSWLDSKSNSFVTIPRSNMFNPNSDKNIFRSISNCLTPNQNSSITLKGKLSGPKAYLNDVDESWDLDKSDVHIGVPIVCRDKDSNNFILKEIAKVHAKACARIQKQKRLERAKVKIKEFKVKQRIEQRQKRLTTNIKHEWYERTLKRLIHTTCMALFFNFRSKTVSQLTKTKESFNQ